MSTILSLLSSHNVWLNFLQTKTEDGHTKKKEIAQLKSFVDNLCYKDIAQKIISDNYQFDYPLRTEINKSGSTKKRVVYRFNSEETLVLKLLAQLLYKYDYKISDACYSFRKKLTAKNAIDKITSITNLANKYVLKVDIHNYFNSIPVNKLATEIKNVVDDDAPLCNLLLNIILANKAYSYNTKGERQLIAENRGAMAGVPLSAFFANIYLTDLDKLFVDNNVAYCRYSDDIIVFADSITDLEKYKQLIYTKIDEKGLTINPDKVKISYPGKEWEFLGFCYRNGKVDLANATLTKIKSKIRRKAKALNRSRKRKNRSFDDVAADLIDHFNRKFYREFSNNDFTWSRWFFPVITTVESLKQIDAYLI